jgi:hypothetical protein
VAKQTLVIESTNLERFFLAVQAGTLQIGGSTAHPEGTVPDLRVVRIRCEVDVEDERDRIPVAQAGVISPQVLHVGSEVRLAHSRLSLQSAAGSGPVAVPAVAPAMGDSSVDIPLPAGPRRLKVTDGGDQGSTFALPDAGVVSVGKAGSADIGLHDLYVAKIHCTLTIESGTVRVAHVEGQSGTLIDNQKLTQPQILRTGSILRVGNSHMRLEVGPFPGEPAAVPAASAKSDGSGSARALPADASGVLRAGPKSGVHKSGDPLLALLDQTVGHHLTNRLLGRGHSGAVFHATNQKTGQLVALKVLSAEFPATQAEVERFAQELRVATPVRHPNLVGVLGAGKTMTNCWIARELVDGESAAEVIARIAGGEKPSWTRAARVAVHLAGALEYLHQHRLVHGNITPQNVLLQTSDNATKLTDLRLKEILAGSQLAQKVKDRKLASELPYMAPEQVEAGGVVDSLSDLYALGALAYALCTGRPPFSGNSPAELREQILNARVIKPSAVYKKVPAAFDAIVLKLLARNQEDRYPTADAVLKDLAPIAESHDLKL